jgi:hypothetical protein
MTLTLSAANLKSHFQDALDEWKINIFHTKKKLFSATR